MSLMKLLTVGQSLRGLNNEPNPYRITEQHLLPKFASVGRPVSLAPPKERFTKPIQVRANLQAIAISPAAIKAGATASAAKAALDNESKRVVAERGERKGWRSLFSVADRTKPRVRRPLVQGEMTLDTVRVMRNDLSEADLEVVVMAAKLEPKPEPASPASPPAVVGSAWSRAATRLITVTRSWL